VAKEEQAKVEEPTEVVEGKVEDQVDSESWAKTRKIIIRVIIIIWVVQRWSLSCTTVETTDGYIWHHKRSYSESSTENI
jgi:hypothetical protein